MSEITVIMPIYHTRPNHLKAAIESVLNQDYTDFRFHILNDSPENQTLKPIIASYKDPRITYFENPHTLGIAKSYNRLLESTDSPLIALMNHDDIALPTRLKRQYAYLKTHPQIVLCGTAYKKFGEINRFKTITPPLEDAKIRAMILFKSPIHHPTIMFRRHIATQHHIRYNENYISLNDRQFYYDMSKHGKLSNLAEPLYKYRFHPEMTSKMHKQQINAEQKAFHAMWFKDNGIKLSPMHQIAFDDYAATGRCRIQNEQTLKTIQQVLEIIANENQKRHFAPEPEFSSLCGKYLMKRCLNAAVYGKIASPEILKDTPLPIQPPLLLNLANYALSWRN
ncbi:MAG: glycosyltransferase [Acetobacter sp.]|nr:glycosyltransferase [Acetobacter sp.]